MNAKTIILTASVLLTGLSGRAQDAMTAQPDSLGRVERLREATVAARRELVASDADKLTYNVEADPQAAGSSLIDILRRVPMVSVNGEEKVLLNGSTDYKVLVNGRPTGMLARNFAQLVKTFPASSVKEIQVITNPPVKYDAEGIGGLINIVLVRRLKAGYSGSVGLQAGTLGMAAGNGYLSAQLGKFAVSASAGGMRFPNPRYYGITDIENLTGTARRYQRLEFEDDVLYSTGSFSLEASYEPDSLNLITLSGWVDLQRPRESFRISERFWDADRNLTADMQEPRQMYNRGDSFSGELAYQRTFRGDGGVLTFSYAIDGIPNGVDNDVTVVRHLCEVIKNGDIAVIYPEARYALCGTTAVLPASLGKLCRLLKVPVVTLICHGHHVNSPFWNLHERGVRPTEAEMRLLFTRRRFNTTISHGRRSGASAQNTAAGRRGCTRCSTSAPPAGRNSK